MVSVRLNVVTFMLLTWRSNRPTNAHLWQTWSKSDRTKGVHSSNFTLLLRKINVRVLRCFSYNTIQNIRIVDQN